MADVKISELTALTSPDGAEELVVNDGGTTKKITITNATSAKAPIASPSFTGTVTANKGSAGTLLNITDGVNTDFIVKTTSLVATAGPNAGSTSLALQTSGSERLRISAAGDVLVGTTVDVFNSATASGVVSYGVGSVTAARANSASAIFNRTGSDGTVVDLRKDGTNVGSIGSRSSGTALQIYTSSTGIDFGGDGLLPMVGSTITDNSRDIGSGSYRFKDAYLSGGVYLGGTGAANKLDVYEEGTFVATLRGTTSDPSTAVTTTSMYRKIGETVYITIPFENWSTTGASGDIQVTGLPFTSSPTGRFFIVGAAYNGATWTDDKTPVFNVQANSTKILCHAMDSNGAWDTLTHNAGSSGRYFWFSGTYPTGA